MTTNISNEIPADIRIVSDDLFNLPGKNLKRFFHECHRTDKQEISVLFKKIPHFMGVLLKCKNTRSRDAWTKKIRPRTPNYIGTDMENFVAAFFHKFSFEILADIFDLLAKKFSDAGELYFNQDCLEKSKEVEMIIHHLQLIRIEFKQLAEAKIAKLPE